MTDYNYTISLANSLDQRASELKSKANNMNQLTSIVGNSYIGTDANAYKNAVLRTKAELNSIADDLTALARRIRTAAYQVKGEEEAEAAAKVAQP